MPVNQRKLRELRQSAMAGNHSAARALCKLYHRDQEAAEIKRGVPFNPRVQRMVNALTAGTSAEGEPLNEWEFINERGEIENLAQTDPPSPRLRKILED
jgi:hypothetical protein